MTSPPSQVAIAARCTTSAATIAPVSGASAACPVSGHVTSPATPAPSRARRRHRAPLPRSTGGSRAATTASAARRPSSVRPNGLASTSASSVTETSHSGAPLAYGACVQSAPSVAAVVAARPARTSRIGPRRDTRRGQSSASSRAGPMISVSPAYPRNLRVGTAAVTVPCTRSGSLSGGRAEGAPTEKVSAPPIGWLSAETIR
nr:hypothetical protein GCM10020092_047250 [Actinoplanes digitatis]